MLPLKSLLVLGDGVPAPIWVLCSPADPSESKALWVPAPLLLWALLSVPPSHLAPDLGTPSTKPNTGSALPCSNPIPSWGVPTPAAQGCLCCPHHSPLCLGRCPALRCPACVRAELAIKYLRVLIAFCRRLGCCREVGGQRGWGWPSHYNRVNEPPSFVASFGGEAEQEPVLLAWSQRQ